MSAPGTAFAAEAGLQQVASDVARPGLSINEFTAPPDGQGRYMTVVRFNEASLAAYGGGVNGLSATNPRVLGQRKLNVDSPASQAYRTFLEQRQEEHLARLSSQLNRQLDVKFQYLNVLNAVAVPLTIDEANKVRELDGVRAVFLDEIREMDTDRGPNFIGATSVWNGDTTAGLPYKGEGVRIGVIDSGANLDHPSFAATASDGFVHTNPFGAGVFRGACAPPTPTAVCNNKLIGAYDFTSSAGGPEDDDGHGSHTASTAGGNPVIATFNGLNIPMSGVAPRANLLIYRVCAPGCAQSASAAAVNQGLADGVDVFNFSISGGDSPWNDIVDLAFLDAVGAGAFVSASAGNSGPGASTVAHTGPWNATVANSLHDRVFGFPLNLTAPPAAPANTQNITIVPGAAPINNTTITNAPIVVSPGFANGGTDGCAAFPANTFRRPATAAGVPAIAVISLDAATTACASGIRRGNALAAGASGVLFVDDQLLNLGASGTSWAIATADWNNIAAHAATVPDTATITITAPLASLISSGGDVMNAGSSRGPSQFDLIKPDISGPGTNILAAFIDSVNGGFNAISGTSMSSPHNAGAAALMVGMNPSWSPARVKSALSLTAQSSMLKEDGVTPSDPFDRGSGRIALNRAGLVSAVMDETLANFEAADPALGGDPGELNLPSIMDRDCIETCTFTRTLTSVLATSVSYSTITNEAPGVEIDVTPANFTLAAGASQVLTIEITTDTAIAPQDVWTFGSISLVPSTGGGGTTPQTFTATPALAIPDNQYRGGFAGATMACSTIDASSLPAGSTASNITLGVAQSHTWVGDLVIKLQTPSGTIMGVMSRPGVVDTADDGLTPSGSGDSSGLVIASPVTYGDGLLTSAENMGSTIPDASNACANDTFCSYFPAQGSIAGPANFAALNGTSAVGNWTLCIGDRANLDTGTFQSWTLNFDSTAPGLRGSLTLPTLQIPVAIAPQAAGPVIDVTPAALDATVDQGGTDTDTVTIANNGGSDLLWAVSSDPARGVLRTGRPTPVNAPNVARGAGFATQGKVEAASRSFPVPNGTLPGTVLSHSTSQTLTSPAGVACPTGPNSFFRVYTPGDFGIATPFPITSVDFGVEENATAQTVTVNIYDFDPADPLLFANMTLAATGTVAIPTGSLFMASAPVSYTIPAGGTVVVEVVAPISATGAEYFPGANGLGQTSPSFVAAAACAITEPTDYTTIGFPNAHLVLNISSGIDVDCGVNGNAEWATLAPTSGTVAPAASQQATLTYNATGLAAGVHETNLCIDSNDPADPLTIVPVEITVGAAPVIELSDASFAVSLPVDGTTTETLGIENVGGLDLTWEVATQEVTNVPNGGPSQLYDNGPIVTNPGGGAGGADLSMLQNPPMTTLGAGANSAAGVRLADQFTVTDAGGWTLSSIELFSYQTGSSTGTSTITSVNYQIWDGPPNDPASTVVFGDTTTNRLVSSAWDNVFRASNTTPTDTARPVMSVIVSGGAVLPPGTYWLDFALTGSLASGPWVPPITITGQTTTGDALQQLTGVWSNLQDGGSLTQLGVPFVLNGTAGPAACVDAATIPWLSLAPTSGTALPGETDNVTVSFDATGLAADTYEAEICVASNDANNGLLTVPVTLVVGVPPTIDVSETEIDVTVAPGGTTTSPLAIGNTGQSDLTWTIDESEAAARGYTYGNPGGGTFDSPTGASRGRSQAGGTASRAVAPAPQGAGPINTSFTEAFDNVAGLAGAGWALTNNSTPIGTTSWFQGNDAVFPAQAGAPTAYIGANFNNVTGNNTISNWLITPHITLQNGTELRFWTRTTDAPEFPDRLEVRLSTAGASVNVGATNASVGDFTTLLLTVNPTLNVTDYPNVWTEFVVTVSGLPAPTDGRFAFRYFVTSGGPAGANSDFIGIDTFAVNQPLAAGCDAPSDIPWLSATPNSGTTAAGGSTNVSVGFNAGALAPGEYNAQLCINSNDPATPRVTVPVSMTVAASLALAPPTLPNGTVGVAYSTTITASGGTAPYTFAVTTGTLPAGLTLATNGTLSGTPTAAGSFPITVTATDSTAGTPITGTINYTLVIAQGSQTITFAPLPDRNLGEAPFTVSATASSGLPVSFLSTTPLVCSVSGATVTLLDEGVCTIRASQAGDANWAAAPNVDQSFDVTAPDVVVLPADLPDGVIDVPYTAQVTASATGATLPFTFAVTSGALPTGLTLAANGAITGTPTVLGDFTFTITATDSTPAGSGGPFTGSQAYTVSIVDTFIFADGFEGPAVAKRIDLQKAGVQLISLPLNELVAGVDGEQNVADLMVDGKRVGVAQAKCAASRCQVRVVWRQADAKVAQGAWLAVSSDPMEIYVEVGSQYITAAGAVEQ